MAGPWEAAKALQAVEVPYGVDGLFGREVGRVGGAPAGWLAGVGLDQAAVGVDPDQRPVGPGLDPLADEVARH